MACPLEPMARSMVRVMRSLARMACSRVRAIRSSEQMTRALEPIGRSKVRMARSLVRAVRSMERVARSREQMARSLERTARSRRRVARCGRRMTRRRPARLRRLQPIVHCIRPHPGTHFARTSPKSGGRKNCQLATGGSARGAATVAAVSDGPDYHRSRRPWTAARSAALPLSAAAEPHPKLWCPQQSKAFGVTATPVPSPAALTSLSVITPEHQAVSELSS